MYKIKEEYRRNLPHLQTDNSLAYFVTTRLVDSLPKSIIEQLQKENERQLTDIATIQLSTDKKTSLIDEQNRRYFGKFDQFLDAHNTGPHWFRSPTIAQLVYDSFLYFHEKRYEMICFTIMSNHVHLLFWINDDRALYGIMHSLKRYIANKLMDREGAFWTHENFDRAVRNNEELKRVMHYILMNPIKAGIVENWKDYPWTFVNEKYFTV